MTTRKRIGPKEIAADAYRELDHLGVLTPAKLAGADWQAIVDALGRGHYKRYDESTARELINIGQRVQDEYGGRLGRLRDGVGSRKELADRVQEFKGVGPTAAGRNTMTETQHLQPGPDHPIRVLPGGAPVTATFAGVVVAATTRPVLLEEASDLPVYYFPREDLEFGRLTRTDHRTHCPYKGDCSYFAVTAGERTGTNAAWSYEQTYDAVAEIAGYLAFDPEQVDVNVVD